MRKIALHDTRTGSVRPLDPRGEKVGIYACGPTVYGRIHIGNARPFVVFSLLKRFLDHEGQPTTFVANITDVNDKIYDAARPAGIPSAQLAAEMTAHYLADTEGLGLGRPDHEPKASEYIEPIVALIARLIDEGAAYAVDGDVYFAVRTDEHYGELSHRSVDDMDQGEGVEGAARKRDPLDFALWKAQKEGEDTAWDAPWGRGRPGWHIECSAMAEELLGLEIDVHGGGSDLVFPHHENEAAQTRKAHGRELAQTWMHNGMLELRRGEKMAKSVGNITPLHEALETWGRDALILFFVGGHYRQPIAWNDDVLAQAQTGVRRLRELGRRVDDGGSPPDLAPLRERFFAALADDFNTPQALAALWEWVGEANRRLAAGEAVGRGDLAEMLGVLGLENLLEAEDAAPPEVVELAQQRQTARAARDFAESDRLRDEIRAHGWEVRDTADGFELARGVIVYGRNAVRELVRAGRRAVERAWATKGAARDLGLQGARIVEAGELERLCGSPDHQGVCAQAAPYPYAGEDELLAAPDPLIVALDEIQDPQNLGAICRTAECVGATGVVMPERRAAEVTPAVCKASAGAVEWLRIARVRNLADFLTAAKDAGCWCYGAAAEGAAPYDRPDYRGGVVLALGAEGRGLRPRVSAKCDELVALPLRGHVDSLNVSAAAAALLYEILQQRS